MRINWEHLLTFAPSHLLTFLVALLLVLPTRPIRAAEDSKPEAAAISWVSSLAEGTRRAQAARRPILVWVGAEYCPWCHKLEAEFAKPALRKELDRWMPVYLDQTRAADEADRLGVGPIPALRLLTSAGRQVSALDGFLEAGELVAWLEKHYAAAAAPPDEALLDLSPLEATGVPQLVRLLDQQDPAAREAAIRRLLPYPNLAGAAAVEGFRQGNLATRLAALELLDAWQAPVAGMDPWRPETLTAKGLAALEKWSAGVVGKASPAPKPTAEQLAAARGQLDRLPQAAPNEAEAIVERLARWGEALLPEVTARLRKTATDQEHERLLALRYRLVASGVLSLSWPGGLARLAATDSKQRQQAADELARMAGAGDQRLLLELFSDPDPLVREISLRGLQHIGGKEATDALIKLLGDPDLNVRAAVLKQLTEAPSRKIVPQVAEYLAQEKDPDLVVHAVRFLMAAGSRTAIAPLIAALAHPQWQVRAEAAEGLGKLLEGDRYGRRSDSDLSMMADTYAALLKLLDDPDAFVVSRAVGAMKHADMVLAVEPLVKAAAKHPDLTAQIVEILSSGQKMRSKAVPYLRTFCRHANPAIRAAAIQGLSQADEAQEQIAAGLADPESSVRIAAATAVFSRLEEVRQKAYQAMENPSVSAVGPSFIHTEEPSLTGQFLRFLVGGVSGRSSPPAPTIVAQPAPGAGGSTPGASGSLPAAESKGGQAAHATPALGASGSTPGASGSLSAAAGNKGGQAAHATPADPWDAWLEAFYAGRGQPKWMTGMIAPLEKMLNAKEPEERVEAALCLVPLGKKQRALTVLLRSLPTAPDSPLVGRAAQVLPWLVWQERLKVFDVLHALPSHSERHQLIYAFNEIHDLRAAERLWQLLATHIVKDKDDDGMVNTLENGLRGAYFGNNSWSPWQATGAQRREASAAARARVGSGGATQRLVALVLLADVAADEALAAAERMAADARLDAILRQDAFQAQLLLSEKKTRTTMALEALAGKDLKRRKVALAYFVRGTNALTTFHGYLQVHRNDTFSSESDDSRQAPKPPAGLKPEHVRTLLHDSDPQTAANAGYLLALLGDPAGLEPLLRYWRQQPKGERELDQLVYRAIAVLDDASRISLLREIYARFGDEEHRNDYEIRQFYWTIRAMSGPEILQLRKQIREEVGMAKLQ